MTRSSSRRPDDDVPSALITQDGTVTIADERRLVTILFADLVGFSGRAEQADPEAVREMQRSYFSAVASEVERFGGTVEKFIGDAVMALFGVPQAHDDDAERALRTALHIRDAVGRLGGRLEVRIGVNTGEVVAGPGAGPQAGAYTVSGDAVNVAARLQQAAAPDEILVGSTTRALSADVFAFAPVGQMTLKGRTEPTDAWRLEHELPERPRTHGGEARLVGRERELAALASALEEARSGRGLLVALVGEPGIGKSRLALEIRHRAEANGFASAWTTSRSYASAFPYHLVRQLVQRLLGRRPGSGPGISSLEALRGASVDADEPTLERWAAVLGDVLGEAPSEDERLADLSPAGRQRMLVHAIGGLIRAASLRAPMLVVLDDLHWADPTSLAVVEELLDDLPDLRLILLATYRSGWSHGWEGRSAYEQLNLRALRPEEARRMAAESAPDLTPEQTERVLERSAGNPLFLEELLRGETGPSGGHAHRLPETIHEILLARLDTQPPDARRTLQLASVVGMEFSERIVASLAAEDAGDTPGHDGTDEALRTLQRAELIVPRPADGGGRTLAFRHPLIHEVAYRSLLVSTRKVLHGRIGRRLEELGGDELVSELARHYRDGDDPDKARTFLPLAGERAAALNANREAHGWFTDAAEAFADEPTRRAQMIEAAAQQSYLLGEIGAATRQQEEAIRVYESVGATVAGLNARRWLGRFRWLRGDPREAERQIGLAIDGLERLGPSPELAMAYSFHAQSVMLEPDVEAGEEWARKAIAVAEATGATAALVHAYNNLGLCLLGRDDPAGIDHLRRSLELALEHHLPDDVGRAYTNLTGQGSRIFPFPYAEQEALLSEAIAYAARTIPDGIFDRWIRSGYAEFMLMSGRWPEAEGVLEALHTKRGEAYLETEVQSLRSRLAGSRGRYDEALDLTVGAADDALRIGDLQAVLPVLTALAAAQAGMGDDMEAISTFRRAIEHRGTNREALISTWFLFEATDTLTAIRARDAGSAAVRSGVELLGAFAAALAPDATRRGDLAQTAVRHALFGAAVEQLASLARAAGLAVSNVRSVAAVAGRVEAAAILDREHRTFDAARIRLWVAEDSADGILASDASRVFEELAAHPYVARSHRLGVPSR
jgi:adenylate cyclase